MAEPLAALRERAEAAAAVVEEAATAMRERKTVLDRLHNARANKDKAEREKLRNRTLGMARQQVREMRDGEKERRVPARVLVLVRVALAYVGVRVSSLVTVLVCVRRSA